MGIMRKTITVTDQQDKWIEAIRSELIKGEKSGEPEPFDAELFKEEMVAKYVGQTS